MTSSRQVAAIVMVTALAAGAGIRLGAQTPAQAPPAGGRGGKGRGGGGGPRTAYPPRPPADPAVVERGKALYGVHCAFCHGAEARGGDGGGPNLLRSDVVLLDQSGELITPIVQKGRPDRGMDPINLSAAQVADIAAFVHSFRVGGYDVTRRPPPSILVGDAARGEAAFNTRCGACHSSTGDLKGFGARFSDPRQLQQAWIMPPQGGGRGAAPTHVPPTTVTVTLASGQKIDGTLSRIDDFVVSLTEADGTFRSFARRGDVPNVDVHDPLKPHRELLAAYSDTEIHDITAYLVSLK